MEGRGEEYKYVVLFDLATVDLLTAPEPEWGQRRASRRTSEAPRDGHEGA